MEKMGEALSYINYLGLIAIATITLSGCDLSSNQKDPIWWKCAYLPDGKPAYTEVYLGPECPPEGSKGGIFIGSALLPDKEIPPTPTTTTPQSH